MLLPYSLTTSTDGEGATLEYEISSSCAPPTASDPSSLPLFSTDEVLAVAPVAPLTIIHQNSSVSGLEMDLRKKKKLNLNQTEAI